MAIAEQNWHRSASGSCQGLPLDIKAFSVDQYLDDKKIRTGIRYFRGHLTTPFGGLSTNDMLVSILRDPPNIPGLNI
ncbi:hypothetical protein ABKN59_004679 [Abortiporus biennis]